MLQTKSRFPAQGGKAISFWYFVVTATAMLLILQKVILVRAGFDWFRNLPTIPFSIFLWIAYRVARMQPWWPFGGEDFQISAEITSKSEPRPQLRQATVAALQDAPREARVTKVFTAEDLKRLHAPVARTSMGKKIKTVLQAVTPSMPKPAIVISTIEAVTSSSGRVRFKTHRRKVIRHKIVGRSRRK